jgi:hypothetical protein
LVLEIRHEIFKIVMPTTIPDSYYRKAHVVWVMGTLAPLCLNRQCYEEAIWVLYGCNMFLFRVFLEGVDFNLPEKPIRRPNLWRIAPPFPPQGLRSPSRLSFIVTIECRNHSHFPYGISARKLYVPCPPVFDFDKQEKNLRLVIAMLPPRKLKELRIYFHCRCFDHYVKWDDDLETRSQYADGCRKARDFAVNMFGRLRAKSAVVSSHCNFLDSEKWFQDLNTMIMGG